MKKSTLAGFFVVMWAALLGSAAFAAPVNIKFAHSGSLEHQYNIGAEHFKKLVEEASGGEMQITIFPQGQLGGERELAESVRMGTVEIGAVAASNMAGFVPELQVFGIPFLFPGREQVYAALDGSIGSELAEYMLKKGFASLSFWEVGFRNMTNNVRPVKVPADMKDLKIRVQESKIWIEFMRRLGAVATPIPFGELYTALQQKVTDGEENPIATIYSMKFYEVQKYISMTGHTYEPALVIANAKWLEGLDPKHREILKDAAAKTAAYQRETLAQLEKERLEAIRKTGVEIEENPDKAAFAEVTKDLYKVVSDVVPEALVQRIRDEVAKAR
ncbi:TRAP transporter substrate-binding protein [Fretibacterium sp. OH1220_COT-178]|uniref:TRAP transporter substrate-binding protein n=1 Tax=Fretibacterium sp. OH1220_COT-178 TaxID=2491047 RepID=UPI000F5D7D57|nr:DctP family TRAP transporter solute-binding subunit [Fretibacterium sp. OH1220_COT-178]RRD63889.1 DctP family TRAP transporter solute-binding subunit [Fretibacterium sp. OH1220_COT-178]